MLPVMSADDPAAAKAGGPSMTARRKSAFWMTLGSIAASVACLALALRGTNLREIGSILSRSHLWLGAPLLLLQVPFYFLKAVRWRLLLIPVREERTSRLVAPMMVGFMGNNILPARIGEIIRMYLGARLMRVTQSQMLGTLILERVFDFVAVLVFFGVGVVVLGDVPDGLVSVGYIAAAMSAVAMMGATAYVVWTGPMLRIAERVTRLLPPKLGSVILRQLELGASGMGSLRRPGLLVGIVTTSLLQWFLMAACIYCSFVAVDLSAPLSAAFVVLAATVFGAMIPAAPGFVGTMHLAFVLALAPFAVPEGTAMAAAVFFHTIPYIGVTLGGLYYLRQTGVRFRQLGRETLES
jgi:uncharacterized protein (TIRG00374 family)